MVIFVIVSISAILYTEYMAMAMKRTLRKGALVMIMLMMMMMMMIHDGNFCDGLLSFMTLMNDTETAAK